MENESGLVRERESLTAWLYRPYIDLGPFSKGPLHIHRIEFSYHNLVPGNAKRHRLQRVLPHSFRESVVRESGLTEYAIKDPLSLPQELATERWSYVCALLREFSGLGRERQADVLALLSSLCLYPAVEYYCPAVSSDEIRRDEASAAAAYWKANARFMLFRDYDTPYHIDEFRVIAESAPLGGIIRFNSQIHMIVQSARFAKKVDAVEHWSATALRELKQARNGLDDFTYTLFMSRFYRAASFGAQMRDDRNRLVEEMDLAQEYAEALPKDTEEHRILADENLHPLLQSRTKEALWLGDLDLAEDRARRVIGIDDLDPRARMELGEVLANKGNFAEAASFYRSAAQLGPPATAMAWFMAGQCYEHLGDLEHASDCYLATLRFDPLGLSAAERLKGVEERLGHHAVALWAAAKFDDLRAEELVANRRRTN